jgi:hypothetical protein
MEGKTQSWVADQLKIDQSTVSRLIQRYERWEAHARDREGGRLDASERLRAQRSITFQRNELLLASCLRIAKDMEGFIDTSKSTISRSPQNYSKENEIRTVHSTIDRTGAVARFLRLAFRINMEQLKLASLDSPPPAAPLTDEDLDQQDRDIATFTKELLAAGFRPDLGAPESQESEIPEANPAPADPAPADSAHADLVTPDLVTRVPPGDALPRGSSLAEPPANPDHKNSPEPMEPAAPTVEPPPTEPSTMPSPTWNLEPGTLNFAAALHNLHNSADVGTPEIAATASEPCTCALHITPEKNSPFTCIIDSDPPLRPREDPPDGTQMALASQASPGLDRIGGD